MSSPLNLIRDGITSGDWSLVVDGYAKITGERLTPPAKAEAEGEGEYVTIVVPASCLSAAKAVTNAVAAKSEAPAIMSTFMFLNPACSGVGSPAASPPPGAWVDDGTMAQETIAESLELSKRKQPERRRPGSPDITVTCCKCGVTETVWAAFAPRTLDKSEHSSYVCNPCVVKNRQND